MRITNTIGNLSLWERRKTLFLTSKMAPIATYERVFGWVDSLTERDTVVCFNSSELEAEVVKALLVNRIPTVLVVMNGFRDKYNVQIERALEENRLLIMELKRDEPRGAGTTPFLRNKFIVSQVQSVVCGYVSKYGTIVLLLGNHNDITYLVDKTVVTLAAEADEKPYRWTVAEDKRLLRMFYEDMGINAIHKATGRPYSTVYKRIKALTMNDELLKGREFEDYVLELLDIPNNNKLTLEEWRGDKSLPGVYPESNSAPDFVFGYDGKMFAVECKWRSHIPRNLEKDLISADRMAYFMQFSKDRSMPIFLLLGIGDLPNSPDCLYFTCLDKGFTMELLLNSIISPEDSLSAKIIGLFSSRKKT